MQRGVVDSKTLEEYRALEIELHRNLITICRRYINHLGIVSIMGILDIVKQETIDLDKARRKNIDREPDEEINKAGYGDISLGESP